MSNDKLSELRDRVDTLRAEVAELAEAETLTPDQEARFDTAIAEFEAAQTELIRLEERNRKVETIRTAPVREPASPTVIRTEHRDIYDLSDIRTMEPKQAAAELRARALDAIEKAPEHMSHDARETATRHVQRDPEIAAHILRTGSPQYHEEFFEYMRGRPVGGPAGQMAEQRAALSLTAANGGYLVPFTLDPTIVLTNDGNVNPFRSISTIKTITTDDWNGVTSAGVTAEWLAEGAESADASPTFGQPSITVNKAAAYIQASVEIVQDSGIAGEIAGLIADAKSNLEAAAFATGSGSGQPQGIVTALIAASDSTKVAGTSGALGAAQLVAADIYAVDNDLPSRHRPNASWMANKAIWNSVRQLGTANNYHAFWADFGGGVPPSLIGYPVYESSEMDSTIVSGSTDSVMVLGDFRKYYIIDRVGLSIAFNPLVVGATYGRPIGSVGWFAMWRVGAEPVDTGAFRFLVL